MVGEIGSVVELALRALDANLVTNLEQRYVAGNVSLFIGLETRVSRTEVILWMNVHLP